MRHLSIGHRLLTGAATTAITAGLLALAPATAHAAMAPQAINDTVTSAERGAVTLNVLSNDVVDPGLTVSLTDVTLQSFGFAQGVSKWSCPSPATPTIEFNADGEVIVGFDEFACDALPSAPRVATLAYTITDSAGASASATATVTEYRTSAPIAAADDTASTLGLGGSPEMAVGSPRGLRVFSNDLHGTPALYDFEIVQPPTTGVITRPAQSLSGNGDYWDPQITFTPSTPATWTSSTANGDGYYKHQAAEQAESFSYRVRLKSDPSVITDTATVAFTYTPTSTGYGPTPWAPVITAPTEILVSNRHATTGKHPVTLSVTVPDIDSERYSVLWSGPSFGNYGTCSPVAGSLPWSHTLQVQCYGIPSGGRLDLAATVTESATGTKTSSVVQVPVRLVPDLETPTIIVDGLSAPMRIALPDTQVVDSVEWSTDRPDACIVAPQPALNSDRSRMLRCDGYTGPVSVTATVTPLVDGKPFAITSVTKALTVAPPATTSLSITSRTGGSWTWLSAKVTVPSGAQITGQTLVLEKRSGTTWGKVRQTSYSSEFRVPAVHGMYRVRALQGRGFAAAVSRTVMVRTAMVWDTDLDRRFAGLVPCIEKHFDPRRCVTNLPVTVLKQTKSGKWQRYKTTRTRCARVGGVPRKCGVALPKGHYKLTFAGNRTLAPATSRVTYTLR